MDRRTLILLACGLVVLMILVTFIGNVMEGLPSDTVALIDAEILINPRNATTFAQDKKSVEEAMQSEPSLFSTPEYQERWADRLRVAQERMDTAQKDLERVRLLKKEDKRESLGEIDELLVRIRAARILAVNEASEMSSIAAFRVDFKRNRAEKIGELQRIYDAVAGNNFSVVRSKVEQPAFDWPGKREDLNSRLEAITAMVERVNEARQTVQEENGRLEAGGPDEGASFDRLINAATVITELSKTVPANLDQIEKLVPQLYRSWDKILVDMAIREGQDVTFHQKFKIVELTIKDVEKKENEQSVREEWVRVSSSEYKAMEKFLGMAVEHKSAGKYDHEAEKIAHPAGYAYMAHPDQGRNQYGYWQRRAGGGSFWAFYGQYAFMRSMFWGPGYYRPTYAGDYNNYYSSYRSGRTYYGRDGLGRPRYGTGGTFTNTRYPNSAYNRTGGFRNSRYMQSGGTYRGSRYEYSRASTARSSGTRFGGGK